jgi:hypothetical protein
MTLARSSRALRFIIRNDADAVVIQPLMPFAAPVAIELAAVLLAWPCAGIATPGKVKFGFQYEQDFLRDFSGGKQTGNAAPGYVQLDGTFKRGASKVQLGLVYTIGSPVTRLTGSHQYPSWLQANDTINLYRFWYGYSFAIPASACASVSRISTTCSTRSTQRRYSSMGPCVSRQRYRRPTSAVIR